jgi:hypothetical protein
MVIGEVACCFAIIHHIEDVNQIGSANPGGGHPQIVEAVCVCVCVCGYPPFLIQIWGGGHPQIVEPVLFTVI